MERTCYKNHVLLTFDKVHYPLRLPRETASEHPNALRTCQFFTLVTSQCASRHKGVHFFDISAWCVLMCFDVFWCVLDILTWKCASRRNGVHFFDISTSKRGPNMVYFVHFNLETRFAPQQRATSLITWLRTRRFREPTFRPSGATIIGKKHSFSWLSYLFAHLDFLSSDSFSSLIFSLLLSFSLLHLYSVSRLSYLFARLHLLSSDSFSFSDSSHLCFSICPYCRKFDI